MSSTEYRVCLCPSRILIIIWKTLSKCFSFRFIMTLMPCHKHSPPFLWDEDTKREVQHAKFTLFYPLTDVGGFFHCPQELQEQYEREVWIIQLVKIVMCKLHMKNDISIYSLITEMAGLWLQQLRQLPRCWCCLQQEHFVGLGPPLHQIIVQNLKPKKDNHEWKFKCRWRI